MWFDSNRSRPASFVFSGLRSAMPALKAWPTSLYSFAYFSGSFVASFVKRSSERLTSVRESCEMNLEDESVLRETVRLLR